MALPLSLLVAQIQSKTAAAAEAEELPGTRTQPLAGVPSRALPFVSLLEVGPL